MPKTSCKTWRDGHELNVTVVEPSGGKRYRGVRIRNEDGDMAVEFTLGGAVAQDLAEKLMAAAKAADPML